eukprot:2518162-Prymnesium_polylepis.1
MGYGGSMRAAAAQALWLIANNRPITMAQCGALFLSDNSSEFLRLRGRHIACAALLSRFSARGAARRAPRPGHPGHP